MRSFQELESYTVTMRSFGSGDGREEEAIIRYFYKKPGFVRMEFERPRRGALLVYDPVAGKATLRPFRFFSSLVFTLSPKSRLITSALGHTVDESDIGALLEDVELLARGGRTVYMREEPIGGRKASVVRVEGGKGAEADGAHTYIIWFDIKTALPIKVISLDAQGRTIEEVVMDDLEVDTPLPDELFSIG